MSENLDIVAFGPFRLDTARRVLNRDGHPVALSSRAFDILALLVAHHERVMTKDELITRVWRGLAVEENNLAVQVSALRRALGETELAAPLILTVPGQGYRFVGRIEQAAPPAGLPVADPQPESVPAAVLPRIASPAAASRGWRTVAAAAAGAAAACIALYLAVRPAAVPPQPPVPVPPRLSIAVLPFRDLSDDRCCDRFADAVTDDLTTDLSHIPGSVVIARESADVYRDKTLPLAEIGRALNVRYLLEGSLRAEEGNFAINAQLIGAETSAHLWAERFTVPRNHLADAQDAIVHRIASALGVTLIQIVSSAEARERGSDPDALALLFQARSILDRSNTLAAMSQAQHVLEQAIAKQPDFGEALGQLAFLLARKVSEFSNPQFTADLDEARRFTAAALRMAPDSSLAIAAHGLLLLYDQKWQAARGSLMSALATEPESVPIRTALISCLDQLGEYIAEAQGIDELLRIDPEGPNTKSLNIRLGIAYFMLGRPQDALARLTLATAGDADPAHGAGVAGLTEYASLFRIAALQMTGDVTAARDELTRHDRIWPHRTAWMIGSQFTRAQAGLPAFGGFLSALVAAGMPRIMDEHARMGVPATDRVDNDHTAFDPTPDTIPPPLRLIDTEHLQALLASSPRPRVVNVGSGAVTLPATETRCSSMDPTMVGDANDCAKYLIGNPSVGPIVVMGRGVTDWNGYNAALALAHAGVRHIFWYRGGEENWAAASQAYKDLRP